MKMTSRDKIENGLAIIESDEDMVIIVSEKCVKCSDKKLGILKIYNLMDNELIFFVKNNIRRVRVSCDCNIKLTH